MVARVRKDDTVVVVSGKDRGKQGSVLVVLPKKDKILVKGVAIATRHVKARKAGDTAGIRKEELFIDTCKVMPVCTTCKKACRTASKKLDSGKTARMCVKCKAIF